MNIITSSKNGWYIDSIFTDKEQGTIDEFIEKEGKWFNYIKGKEVQHFIGYSSNNPFTGIVLNDNGTSSLEQGSFAVQGIGTLSTLYKCTILWLYRSNSV
jgi:hypothetical protein